MEVIQLKKRNNITSNGKTVKKYKLKVVEDKLKPISKEEYEKLELASDMTEEEYNLQLRMSLVQECFDKGNKCIAMF